MSFELFEARESSRDTFPEQESRIFTSRDQNFTEPSIAFDSRLSNTYNSPYRESKVREEREIVEKNQLEKGLLSSTSPNPAQTKQTNTQNERICL